MRRIFEDYSGKHPGEVAEDTDRAPSAEEVAAGEVREAIPPAAELRCSAVVSADATCDEARATIEEPRPPRFLKGSTKARIEDRLHHAVCPSPALELPSPAGVACGGRAARRRHLVGWRWRALQSVGSSDQHHSGEGRPPTPPTLFCACKVWL